MASKEDIAESIEMLAVFHNVGRVAYPQERVDYLQKLIVPVLDANGAALSLSMLLRCAAIDDSMRPNWAGIEFVSHPHQKRCVWLQLYAISTDPLGWVRDFVETIKWRVRDDYPEQLLTIFKDGECIGEWIRLAHYV